ILFTSTAFYPINLYNKTIGLIGDYLPLNPILNILRHDDINYAILLAWLIVPMVFFYFIFKNIKTTR
ncbi:MAG: hypothetical protein LBE13_04325, partial [Bacteroidales bacterium]|nr:hypothetical protein [Bacteroidales bacterium]